jgi:hypothetical protein
MVATIRSANTLVAIGTNLRMLFGKQFRRGLSLLQSLDLRVVHVELLARLPFMPRKLVYCTGLVGTCLADHHGVVANVNLTGATVEPQTHDHIGRGYHREIFISKED